MAQAHPRPAPFYLAPLALVASLLALPAAATGAPSWTGGQGDPARVRELVSARSDGERLVRDGALSFNAAAVRRALAALDRGPTSEVERGAALMALGAGGAEEERLRLESFASGGPLSDRIAATLALGELGTPAVPYLRAATGRATDEPALREAALFAFALTGADEGRRAVEEAVNRGEVASRTGVAFLRYLDARLLHGDDRRARADAVPPLGPTVHFLLELRWQAARRFGMVDGHRWNHILTEAVIHGEAFLDRVVLEAAVDLSGPAVEDHLLEILIEGEGDHRLRAVAAVMPHRLVQIIESGLWTPSGADDWRVVLGEIERRRLERQSVELLELALRQPDVTYTAGLLLLRAGALDHAGIVVNEMASPEPSRREAIAHAFGLARNPDRVPDLLRLRDDGDARVRAAALVALVRLRHDPSKDVLRALLLAGPSDEREAVLGALASEGRHPGATDLVGWLEAGLAQTDLDARERFALEIALATQGRLETKDSLRAFLGRDGGGPLLPLVVRALAVKADERDLLLMRERFPTEDQFDLDVDLALALLRAGDPLAQRILRIAMWRGSWNRSALAAGLFVKRNGIHALIEELGSPPPEAQDADIRRLGFAVGEWGGLAALDELARRRGPGDPALQGAYLGALSTRTH
jgi:HEAT repeat protein